MALAGACIVVICNARSYRTRDLTRPSHSSINQENMGDTSKWNTVKEQILNIGNEICGNKKLGHKQQWMTEEILEKMEQRK